MLNELNKNKSRVVKEIASIRSKLVINEYKDGYKGKTKKLYDKVLKRRGPFHTPIKRLKKDSSDDKDIYTVRYERKIKVQLVETMQGPSAEPIAACRCVDGSVTVGQRYKTFEDIALINLPIEKHDNFHSYTDLLIFSASLVKTLFSDKLFTPEVAFDLMGGRPSYIDSKHTSIAYHTTLLNQETELVDRLMSRMNDMNLKNFILSSIYRDRTLVLYMGQKQENSEYRYYINLIDKNLTGIDDYLENGYSR